MMPKIIVKITVAFLIILLVSVVGYLGYRKIEQNKIQAEISLAEMQSRLDSQKSIMDAQQSKIDELQGFKEQQQSANEQMSEQGRQNKKSDCASRLKKAQDNLAASQRSLDGDQKALKIAESGTCADCYKTCMKSVEDDGSDMFEKAKKQCKKNDEDNLKFRKSDVAGDLENIKKLEMQLQAVENECSQYS